MLNIVIQLLLSAADLQDLWPIVPLSPDQSLPHGYQKGSAQQKRPMWECKIKLAQPQLFPTSRPEDFRIFSCSKSDRKK